MPRQINQTAATVLSRMSGGPLLVAPNNSNFQSNMTRFLASEDTADEETTEERVTKQLCAAYGFDQNAQRKPFAFQDGVAVIPVHGTLINRFGSTYGFVTGYNYIQRLTRAAVEDPDVSLIVYDHDSGGGEVSGAFETSEIIAQCRGVKPTMAVVDSGCYSASYMLAAPVDAIYVTPTGGVGSIGVWTMHVDMSKMLADYGFDITLVQSGEHKTDGNPFGPLPAEVRAEMQAQVDKTREKFVALVAENRSIDAKVVHDTEGRCYDVDQAMELGLIDGIASPSNAISDFLTKQLGASEMATTTTTPQAADAAPAAAAPATPVAAAPVANNVSERQRIREITTCAEAEGRKDLADHLAFGTDMSAEDAKAILGKAPVAAAPAAPVAAADTPFSAAMANTPNPEIGSDAAGSENAELKGADLLAHSYTLATGNKL